MKEQNRVSTKRVTGFLILACFIAMPATAHPVNIAMEKVPVHEMCWFYTKMGILHIIPYGSDHILFVTGLCLLSSNIKSILWQATAFTLAHSITLTLSMQNILVAPGSMVEPVISLSIAFVAVENLLLRELKPWRILIVFLFGLIHGMGFASALSEVGLPRNNFFSAVLAFNLGVELGQVTVILIVFGLLIKPLSKRLNFRKYLVYPLSVTIAVIALYWTAQRIIGM